LSEGLGQGDARASPWLRDYEQVRAGAPATFPAPDDFQAFMGGFAGRHGVGDGLLGSLEIAQGDELGGRHGSQPAQLRRRSS